MKETDWSPRNLILITNKRVKKEGHTAHFTLFYLKVKSLNAQKGNTEHWTNLD
jgi:hypothetical protein